jgi:hypothetical protein
VFEDTQEPITVFEDTQEPITVFQDTQKPVTVFEVTQKPISYVTMHARYRLSLLLYFVPSHHVYLNLR